jgi:DNA-binding MarR family transcriptional regulator
MKKISSIGSLLKKSYRIYSNELLNELQSKGFIDLRPSFLEILMYICEHVGPSIKEIGSSCGLKKQTMTSHLNELEKRGYVLRKTGDKDRRELKVYLTDYGEKFKIALLEVSNNLESEYLDIVGAVEIDRIIHTLENFHSKINKEEKSIQTLLI